MKELFDEFKKDHPIAALLLVCALVPAAIISGFVINLWSAWWLQPVWNALPFPDLTLSQFFVMDALVGVMASQVRPKDTEGIVAYWAGVLIGAPIMYVICMWML